MATMESIEALEEEKIKLEKELSLISHEIQQRKNNRGKDSLPPVGESTSFLPSQVFTRTNPTGRTLSKSGYLSKWQDRSIGWSGTKWDLRFVRLERGRLSYFLTHHNDPSPRYVLTLKNCAVRDDGYKPNKRFKDTAKVVNDGNNDEMVMRTPGACHHVFSIYQRPKQSVGMFAEDDDEDQIVPLLRFSTENYAEKMQWMEMLAEACAYCDSDEFQKDEEEYQKQQAAVVPQTPSRQNRGTLPRLYFESLPPKIKRQPSHVKMKTSTSNSHLKLNKNKDSAKSNSKRTSDYPPSKPMHRASEPSYLSDEAPMQNYRGLLNLGLIILVISNFRILLTTTREYGFVLTHLHPNKARSIAIYTWEDILNFPLLYGMGILNVFVVYAYLIKLFTSRKMWNESFGLFLHVINTNSALCIPTAIVWYQIQSPITGALLVMTATVLWMKLISYAHANADYRRHPERSNHDSTDFITNKDEYSKALQYPQNITLPNIYYFWFAPTLTYQIVFPRLVRRNKLRILTLGLRLFLTNVLIIFLIAQIIRPTLSSLVQYLEEGGNEYSIHIFFEYMLKLGIASTYIWLLVFYGFFHVFLNFLAEALKFGDRVFYKDWWNSSNLSSYWRLWNLPVHYWLVRHLYFPCVRRGMSKNGATFLVFFFSAVLHELLISIPFHMIKPYSFLGMMSQIPLIGLTKYLDRTKPGSSIGNMIFWLSFCIVGQPMAVIMYTIDHWKQNSRTGYEGSFDAGNANDEL